MSKQREIIENYFRVVERFETDPEAYRDILHPELEQTEYPNAITKTTAVRSIADMMVGAAAGRQLLQSQTYEIRSVIEQGETVAAETLWTGIIAADRGPFKQGQAIVAHFCVVFEFRDGLIYRQRNYDCFDPFA